ncbi:aldo/keto reductase [Quadrisphaera sp. INWT6]|uniref:aldo/keto reductase n=1 Tax=Quadrisphaera sp. INWT6 TaxID=2596917 RepID=UPI0018921CAD|nr:aldo/keto reductase [Quadrisphaera sp. INWT6]MBF5082176.1 aldo/keto reductase [Quadrisphaera sp. INWT6]
MDKRDLGTTGLQVTPLCVGTSPLGNFPSQYGYEVGEDQAVETVLSVLGGPLNFMDTSNNYGDGESERRIGKALAEAGGPPPGFVLATKVDPAPGSEDFSGERVRASVQESLERLGLDRLQLVHLHDPERISFEQATAPDGAVQALVDLQREGLIEHLGVAGGPIDLMLRYLELDVFAAVISHNRYTLVDSSAEPLIADAASRGVAFLNAAPYGGGMLVRGPQAVPNYCYQPASAQVIARVEAMQQACQRHEVPLAAAALQFSLRDERVASTIVGMSTPQRVAQTTALAEHPIPEELWSQLLELAAEGRSGVGL